MLNGFVLPMGLQGLVYATWKFRDATLPSCGADAGRKAKVDAPAEPTHHSEAPDGTDVVSAEEMERETTASRFGDHYFALFLICETKPQLCCNALRY